MCSWDGADQAATVETQRHAGAAAVGTNWAFMDG